MSELTAPASECLFVGDTKPNYVIMFHDENNKEIGRLDLNGPTMKFEGDAEKSAKLFFDLIAQYFQKRLEEEREAGRLEASQRNTA